MYSPAVGRRETTGDGDGHTFVIEGHFFLSNNMEIIIVKHMGITV
jgi:hypothetical protein